MYDELNGWNDIIKRMMAELEPFNINNISMKEKWGELRVRFNFNGTEEDEKLIRQIIAKYSDLSYETCQQCGKPGDLRKLKTGWLKTLCEECLKNLKY